MARAKKAKPADRRLLKQAEREERENAELINQAATRILSRLRELANLPLTNGTVANAPPPNPTSQPRIMLRLTADPVGDGEAGIRDDAELGNVILDMFRDSYSDPGRETFTQAVTRCTVDELAILEFAVSGNDDYNLEEVPRMLERLRHRLSRRAVARQADCGRPAVEGGRRCVVNEAQDPLTVLRDIQGLANEAREAIFQVLTNFAPCMEDEQYENLRPALTAVGALNCIAIEARDAIANGKREGAEESPIPQLSERIDRTGSRKPRRKRGGK